MYFVAILAFSGMSHLRAPGGRPLSPRLDARLLRLRLHRGGGDGGAGGSSARSPDASGSARCSWWGSSRSAWGWRRCRSRAAWPGCSPPAYPSPSARGSPRRRSPRSSPARRRADDQGGTLGIGQSAAALGRVVAHLGHQRVRQALVRRPLLRGLPPHARPPPSARRSGGRSGATPRSPAPRRGRRRCPSCAGPDRRPLGDHRHRAGQAAARLPRRSQAAGGGLCPFCEGHEDKTPPEILAYATAAAPANGPGWRVRVVPNKFPALKIEGDLNKRGEGIYDKMSGIGAHEVIIETPAPRVSMAELSEDNIREVLWVYRDRLVDLRRTTAWSTACSSRTSAPRRGRRWSTRTAS